MLVALKIFNTFFLNFFLQTLGKQSEFILMLLQDLEGHYCLWTLELLCEKLSQCGSKHMLSKNGEIFYG